jgi:signal transduction histidine kinase
MHVEIALDLDAEISPAYVDSDILSQIFTDLIRNSMQEMESEGTLSIRTFESDQNVYVVFRNPTNGGKPRDPEHFFLPFDENQHGIGLPLCYRLLKEMGGLLLFSQEEGSIVFTVSLLKAFRPNSSNIAEVGGTDAA